MIAIYLKHDRVSEPDHQFLSQFFGETGMEYTHPKQFFIEYLLDLKESDLFSELPELFNWCSKNHSKLFQIKFL